MTPTAKSPKAGFEPGCNVSVAMLKRAACQTNEHSEDWDVLRVELEARKRFDVLIADLSAVFLNQPPERFDDVIDSSLESLAALLGHDRSTLAEFRGDDDSAVVTHSYAVPSTTPFPLGALDGDRFPWDLERIRRGDAVFVRHPSELPPEAERERQYYAAEQIKSNVAIPLKVGGAIIGAITFTFLGAECRWDELFVSRLQLVGDIFANALLHKRSQDALRAALAEGERLRCPHPRRLESRRSGLLRGERATRG